MTDKIKGTSEAWESGELGEDEKFAEKANVTESDLDEALELQMISIRLQKSLIDDLKNFALIEGLGYQPLMKRILMRWIDGEKKMIANRYLAERKKAEEQKYAEKSVEPHQQIAM